jgi:hypothetical protein
MKWNGFKGKRMAVKFAETKPVKRSMYAIAEKKTEKGIKTIVLSDVGFNRAEALNTAKNLVQGRGFEVVGVYPFQGGSN